MMINDVNKYATIHKFVQSLGVNVRRETVVA